MASDWENEVVGFFHAQRALAKKARRPSIIDQRFVQRAAERARRDERNRLRFEVLELQALIERAWWDHRQWLRHHVVERQAERDAFEQSVEL